MLGGPKRGADHRNRGCEESLYAAILPFIDTRDSKRMKIIHSADWQLGKPFRHLTVAITSDRSRGNLSSSAGK